MSNDETVTLLKEFEGRKLKEVKNMGPNNWAMLFEAEDGSTPSMNFLTGTNVIVVKVISSMENREGSNR